MLRFSVCNCRVRALLLRRRRRPASRQLEQRLSPLDEEEERRQAKVGAGRGEGLGRRRAGGQGSGSESVTGGAGTTTKPQEEEQEAERPGVWRSAAPRSEPPPGKADCRRPTGGFLPWRRRRAGEQRPNLMMSLRLRCSLTRAGRLAFCQPTPPPGLVLLLLQGGGGGGGVVLPVVVVPALTYWKGEGLGLP